MLRIIIAVFAALILPACSAIPDAEYQYYPSKSLSTIAITQTVACNKDKNGFVIVTTPTITSAYAADHSSGPFTVAIRDFEGSLGSTGDSDASFTFFDDGRLKSINQSTTGQADAVIKSAVTLATTLSAAAQAFDGGAPIPTLGPECDAIATAQSPPKPGDTPSGAVTFTYQYQFDNTEILTLSRSPPDLAEVSPASRKLFDTIFTRPNVASRIQPRVQVGSFEDRTGRVKPPQACGMSGGNFVDLKLNNTGNVRVDVLLNNAKDPKASLSVWNASVTLPRPGIYCLPIPRAALFGKQNFSLSLNEAGAITAVDYGKTGGAATALNSVNTIATAVAPDSPTVRAADLKAQADLIAQQQRLARCQANPTGCT